MNKFVASLLSASVFLLGLSFFDVRASQDPYGDVFGDWRIVELVGGADIAALSDDQAHAIIGKNFSVGADRLVFDGKPCVHPKYNRRIAEPAAYFRNEWHANSAGLPVPTPVTIIENECYDLFVARKGHLIIAIDGIFFEAVRAGKQRASHK